MRPDEYNKEVVPKYDKRNKYYYFMDQEHPLAAKTGRVWYHRHVASVKLGRWLSSQEATHHLDGDRLNNHPDNIVVMSQSAHARIHGWDRGKHNTIVHCKICDTPTHGKKYCSAGCSWLGSRKVDRPTREALCQDIDNMSWRAIGRKYGVSDNAVRKWAKLYSIIQ